MDGRGPRTHYNILHHPGRKHWFAACGLVTLAYMLGAGIRRMLPAGADSPSSLPCGEQKENPPMIRKSILALALAASLPAQITPTAWAAGPLNPQHILDLRGGFFRPYLRTPSYVPCEVSSVVDIPRAGRYTVHLAAVCGDTGSFSFEFFIGTQSVWKNSNEFGMSLTKTVWLPAGKLLARFRTHTTTADRDHWHLHQFSITPAIDPVIEVHGLNNGSNQGIECSVSTTAHMLAVGLKRVAPIRLPGLTHGLELDPATCVLLVMSPVETKIAIDLAPLLKSVMPEYTRWPDVHFQAVTRKGFGGAVHLAPVW